jgi:hypothetical protein
MNPLQLKSILPVLALVAISIIAHAQSQPRYRIKTLEYDKNYMGGQMEYRKNTYQYNSDRNSIIGWGTFENAIHTVSIIPGLNYDDMMAEQNAPAGGSEPYYSAQQIFGGDGKLFVRKLTELSYHNATYFDTIWYNSHGDTASTYKRFTDDTTFDVRTTYYYNANNRLDSVAEYYVYMKKYCSQKYYVYDTHTGLLEHTFYTYTYTSMTPPFTGLFYEYYTYDNLGRVITINTLGNAWSTPVDSSTSISYEYDNAGNIAKETKRIWDIYEQAYVYSTTSFYAYDANGALAQKLSMNGDGNGQVKDTADMTKYTYDAFNLPYILEKRSWGRGFMYPDTVYKMRYVEKYTAIYELFWPTSVVKQEVAKSSLAIYPVPASGRISFDAAFKEAQAFTIHITDMQGRILYTQAMPASKDYKNKLSLQYLPAANYILTLEGTKEKISRQFELR